MCPGDSRFLIFLTISQTYKPIFGCDTISRLSHRRLDGEECEKEVDVDGEDEQASMGEKDMSMSMKKRKNMKKIAILTSVGFSYIGMRLKKNETDLSKVIFVTFTKNCLLIII
jgi:hypothetical protein